MREEFKVKAFSRAQGGLGQTRLLYSKSCVVHTEWTLNFWGLLL